jgi:uncharacterized protein YggE
VRNRSFIAATVVVAFALPLAVAAPAPALSETPQRQISVIGEGHIDAVPDMAIITLGVKYQAKEAGDAMAATSQATARMLDQLAFLGVQPRDMQTSRLSLNPVWPNSSSSLSDDRILSGFVASNSVTVRLRDLNKLAQIMDAVVADGANNFNGLRFSVQEPEPLMNAARQAAVADAIAKAQLLTGSAGVTLGPVLSITEQGGRSQPMRMEMASARSGGTPIVAGEVTIGATVMMVFAITD